MTTNSGGEAHDHGKGDLPDAEVGMTTKPSSTDPSPPNDGLAIGDGQAIKLVAIPDRTPASASPPKKEKPHPQAVMHELWKGFDPEYLGKVTQVLPESITDPPPSPRTIAGTAHQTNKSYENAKESCKRDVSRISEECRASNQKYTDPDWDIEKDLKITQARDCLDGLVMDDADKVYPADVKRVTDIYLTPQFYVGKTRDVNILQGLYPDCWLIAAISTLGRISNFVDHLCVARDQDVGVYGFVFHRDGEWYPCIIDDKLYLCASAYDESGEHVLTKPGMCPTDQEAQYQELFQRGSRSLYFAQCRDQDETWVSLLEKAYAKAHGDYSAIEGGMTGEAIEDLTGGVTTEIYTTNILDTDRFWKDELSSMGKDLVFSCALASWDVQTNVRKALDVSKAVNFLSQSRETENSTLSPGSPVSLESTDRG